MKIFSLYPPHRLCRLHQKIMLLSLKTIFKKILQVCIHTNLCAWDKWNIHLNRKREKSSPYVIVPYLQNKLVIDIKFQWKRFRDKPVTDAIHFLWNFDESFLEAKSWLSFPALDLSKKEKVHAYRDIFMKFI